MQGQPRREQKGVKLVSRVVCGLLGCVVIDCSVWPSVWHVVVIDCSVSLLCGMCSPVWCMVSWVVWWLSIVVCVFYVCVVSCVVWWLLIVSFQAEEKTKAKAEEEAGQVSRSGQGRRGRITGERE